MAQEPAQQSAFGAELRRWREKRGYSLTGFAAAVNYSPAYLSRIESGRKRPGIDLARRCDRQLDAQGALADLVQRQPSAVLPAVTGEGSGVWTIQAGADGSGGFHVYDCGGILADGAASVLTWQARAAATDDFSACQAILREARRLGQTVAPAAVLPLVIPVCGLLRGLAAQATPASQAGALRLAARFAEYTGWMAQENGNEPAALWCRRTAGSGTRCARIGCCCSTSGAPAAAHR
jgi:hypothetical protein